MATAVTQNSPLQFTQFASRTTHNLAGQSGGNTLYNCPAGNIAFIKLLGVQDISGVSSTGNIDFGVDSVGIIHGAVWGISTTNTAPFYNDVPEDYGQWPDYNAVTANPSGGQAGLYGSDYFTFGSSGAGVPAAGGWFKMLPGQNMALGTISGGHQWTLRFVVVLFSA